jgi:hypothetical protein
MLLFPRSMNVINWVFQRGVFAIVEVAGATLMLRALMSPSVLIEAAALGGSTTDRGCCLRAPYLAHGGQFIVTAFG